MPLARIPELEKVVGGLYCISPYAPCTEKPKDFKIGRTIHYRNRLNSYHLCFNKGFYIYTCLPLSTKYTFDTKENKKIAYDMTKKLEKRAFALLKTFNQHFSTRTHKSEWFNCFKNKVVAVFKKVHSEYPNDTEKPITEWKEEYIHTFDDDGFDIDLVAQDKPLSYLPQEGAKTKSGRLIKSTMKTKFKDMKYLNDKSGKPLNKWQQHIADVKKEHPKLSHKQAMQQASKTYKK